MRLTIIFGIVCLGMLAMRHPDDLFSIGVSLFLVGIVLASFARLRQGTSSQEEDEDRQRKQRLEQLQERIHLWGLRLYGALCFERGCWNDRHYQESLSDIPLEFYRHHAPFRQQQLLLIEALIALAAIGEKEGIRSADLHFYEQQFDALQARFEQFEQLWKEADARFGRINGELSRLTHTSPKWKNSQEYYRLLGMRDMVKRLQYHQELSASALFFATGLLEQTGSSLERKSFCEPGLHPLRED